MLIGGGGAVIGAAAIGAGRIGFRQGAAIVPGTGRARRVISDPVPPGEADVVIVGGGNIGCFAALELAERGFRVVVCEKGVIAGEASGRSLGYVDSLFLDPVKMPLIARSKQLWEGVARRVGRDVGYRRTGVLATFETQDGLGQASGWIEAVKGAAGVDAALVTGAQVARMIPELARKFAGAIWEPNDGYAEPQLLASAVADQIRRLGGHVVQNCAVRGIERSAGHISAAVTEKGTIKCATVVLAGGVWSPVFARSLGLDLPQFMAFGSVARTAPVAGPEIPVLFADQLMPTRRSLHGGYDICIGKAVAPATPSTIANIFRLRPALENMWDDLIPAFNLSTFMSQWRIPEHWALDGVSPFEQNRVFAPDIHHASIDLARKTFAEVLPSQARAPIVEQWAGSLMTTIDNMPVISRVDAIPGLVIGSGFYYGLTMAPAGGEMLADLVTGRTPGVDASLYRFDRFTDGSQTMFRG